MEILCNAFPLEKISDRRSRSCIWEDGFKQQKYWFKALADLGGMPGTCHPPMGPHSFILTYKFFKM